MVLNNVCIRPKIVDFKRVKRRSEATVTRHATSAVVCVAGYSVSDLMVALHLCIFLILGVAGPAFAQENVELEALYQATNGAQWTNNVNWLSGSPCSNWSGITCNQDGNVIEMYSHIRYLKST
jgi:hypothetical protein